MNPSLLPWFVLLDSPGTPVALDLARAGWTLLFLGVTLTFVVLIGLWVGTPRDRRERRLGRMREERERRVTHAHFPGPR